ncbi:energy transducer TonB [Caenimonas sp. SL110]|uniref:energy transducer TonB n=1 Tax=Caenimonas sp. SL110 TaxID=1450524 RepID=UPI0006542199|nr:energy transducer TonB [Caenimonas sp. SL110]
MPRMFTRIRPFIAALGLMLCAIAATTASTANAADAPADKVVYVSPHTSEEPFSSYYAGFFSKLVVGSMAEPPKGVNGQPVEGSVLFVVTVAPTGAAERIDIVESSSPIVEKHVLALIRKSQPFAAFSPEIRGKASKLVITSHLNYVRER